MICGFEISQDLINDIISTSFGGAAAGIALYVVQDLHGKFRDQRDSKRIYEWLVEQSKPQFGWEYRSTRTISSYTNLTEDRVRYLCSQHEKIFLSTGIEEGKWTITERLARVGENLQP